MSNEIVRLDRQASLEEIVTVVNRLIDVVVGNAGGRIELLDDDGERRDPNRGASLSSDNYALKSRSSAGKHLLAEHSNGTDTVFSADDDGLGLMNWRAEKATADLIFKDDGGGEQFRLGDAASAYQAKVTGKLNTTSGTEIGGTQRITASTGAPASGEGIEQAYNPAAHVGTIAAYDRSGSAYKALDIGGSDIKLGLSTSQKVGLYGTTPVAQQAIAAASTDLATVITLANDLRAKLRTLGVFS